MKASVITLGCKVNEYESQSILNQLRTAGYEISEGYQPADVYVVNTCAVTNIAERKSRQTLAKIKKINPEAKIVVCGCAVQNNPAQFLKDKNVLALTGNSGKGTIMDFIQKENKTLPELSHKKYEFFPSPVMTRTRQYIKIQNGCDYFCSYCLIPYLRGRSVSRDMPSILAEIAASEASEIVLTGINMSDYRIDGRLALSQLVKEVDRLGKRFRLSSLEVNVLDDEMIDTLKNCRNFCPHFHLSLQSACNATLKRMNRHYTIEQFMHTVDKLRTAFHQPTITTDIIVGFNGETDAEFETTFNNLQKIKFSFMHIFPYSERAGTVASRMPDKVEKATIKAREKRLIDLNKINKRDFFAANKNTIHSFLVEEIVDEKFSVGYTDNYIYVYLPEILPVGEICEVRLIDPYLKGMKATRPND